MVATVEEASVAAETVMGAGGKGGMEEVKEEAKEKPVEKAEERPKDRTLPHHSTLRLDLGRRTDVPGMWSHSTR